MLSVCSSPVPTLVEAARGAALQDCGVEAVPLSQRTQLLRTRPCWQISCFCLQKTQTVKEKNRLVFATQLNKNQAAKSTFLKNSCSRRPGKARPPQVCTAYTTVAALVWAMEQLKKRFLQQITSLNFLPKVKPNGARLSFKSHRKEVFYGHTKMNRWRRHPKGQRGPRDIWAAEKPNSTKPAAEQRDGTPTKTPKQPNQPKTKNRNSHLQHYPCKSL